MDESVLTQASPGTPAYLEYYERLRRLDRQGAISLVEHYLSEVGDVERLYSDVFMPAMVHTGDEWEQDRISVAHEHYISEVTRDLIHQYGRGRRRRPWRNEGGPAAEGLTAVCCCVPGERHALGLLMVSDVLQASGFQVHMLGEGAPVEAIAAFARDSKASLLCLSCALDEHLPEVPGVIERVREGVPGIRVVLGGAAFRGHPGAAEGLGADHFASDLAELRRLIPVLTGARRRG